MSNPMNTEEQRILKFRAWDKVSKKMSDPFSLFGEFLLIGGVHAWQEEGGPGDCLSRLNDLIVMQFTGLLDKNGKEIYEGDIVVHDGEECAVNFKGGSFGIDFQETTRKPYDRILSSTKWEVIGHIYSSEPIVK